MTLPNTLDRMQLHVDSLIGARGLPFTRVGLLILALYKMRKRKFIVFTVDSDVNLTVLSRSFRCIWGSLASEIDLKHDGFTIYGMIG